MDFEPNEVNFIISKDLLENRIKDGAGLLNLLSYFLYWDYIRGSVHHGCVRQ